MLHARQICRHNLSSLQIKGWTHWIRMEGWEHPAVDSALPASSSPTNSCHGRVESSGGSRTPVTKNKIFHSLQVNRKAECQQIGAPAKQINYCSRRISTGEFIQRTSTSHYTECINRVFVNSCRFDCILNDFGAKRSFCDRFYCHIERQNE